MEDFRKFLTARLAGQQEEGGAHPPADLLAAFAEGSISSGERKRVLTHLSICPECREVVALASGDMHLEPASKESRARWWNLRWATALAAACIVGVVIWHSSSVPSHVVQIPPKPLQPPQSAPKEEAPKPEKPIVAAVPRPKAKRILTIQPAQSRSPLVAAEPPPLSMDEPAKAEQITPVATPASDSLAILQVAPQPAPPAKAAAAFRSLGVAPMKSFFSTARRQSLWSIASSSGVLQKSQDSGKTWTAIPFDAPVKFTALSVSAREIWAGGEDGVLFHSNDDGLHWTEVTVGAGDDRLTESIIGIEPQGSQVTLRTRLGPWRSTDGGMTWRRIGE